MLRGRAGSADDPEWARPRAGGYRYPGACSSDSLHVPHVFTRMQHHAYMRSPALPRPYARAWTSAWTNGPITRKVRHDRCVVRMHCRARVSSQDLLAERNELTQQLLLPPGAFSHWEPPHSAPLTAHLGAAGQGIRAAEAHNPLFGSVPHLTCAWHLRSWGLTWVG